MQLLCFIEFKFNALNVCQIHCFCDRDWFTRFAIVKNYILDIFVIVFINVAHMLVHRKNVFCNQSYHVVVSYLNINVYCELRGSKWSDFTVEIFFHSHMRLWNIAKSHKNIDFFSIRVIELNMFTFYHINYIRVEPVSHDALWWAISQSAQNKTTWNFNTIWLPVSKVWNKSSLWFRNVMISRKAGLLPLCSSTLAYNSRSTIHF